MSDITAQCDALKEEIRNLEKNYEALRLTSVGLRDQLQEAREDLRKNCSTKMELIRLFGDTADHLRVTKEGTNPEVAHRIWAKVNELRKGNSEFLLEVAQATDADTTGTNRNIADSILVQFSKLKEECGRDQRNAARSQKEAAELLDDSRKEREKLDWELKDYHGKYCKLYDVACATANSAGLSSPSGLTKQEGIINILNRLSTACVTDTVDTRIKALEQECYAAESRTGIMCRERHPSARISWVLNQMSCELVRLQTKMGDPPKVPEEILKKLWVVLQNLDATGASMAGEGGEWSTETGKAMALIERIAEKAYKGQNISEACKRLKELL